MKREFIELKSFRKDWEEIGLTDDDLRVLQDLLNENPETGDIMEGTGGVRKVRIPVESGKSGGARVCYTDFEKYELIFLLIAFSKNEKANLTKNERNAVKKLVKSLLDELQRRYSE